MDYILKYPASSALIIGVILYIVYNKSNYEEFIDIRDARGMRNVLKQRALTNPAKAQVDPTKIGHRMVRKLPAKRNKYIPDSYSKRVRASQNSQLMGLSLQNQLEQMIDPLH